MKTFNQLIEESNKEPNSIEEEVIELEKNLIESWAEGNSVARYSKDSISKELKEELFNAGYFINENSDSIYILLQSDLL
jgi:hypothetical protein